MRIDLAGQEDVAAIADLLAKCGLPHEDIAASLPRFLVHREDGRLVGVVGLEAFGEAALLRSLAVSPSHRKRGIASRLVLAVEADARARGVQTLYLLTTTARDFFAGQGYQEAERSAAPEAIQGTTEFATMCPASATCMAKRLA